MPRSSWATRVGSECPCRECGSGRFPARLHDVGIYCIILMSQWCFVVNHQVLLIRVSKWEQLATEMGPPGQEGNLTPGQERKRPHKWGRSSGKGKEKDSHQDGREYPFFKASMIPQPG